MIISTGINKQQGTTYRQRQGPRGPYWRLRLLLSGVLRITFPDGQSSIHRAPLLNIHRQESDYWVECLDPQQGFVALSVIFTPNEFCRQDLPLTNDSAASWVLPLNQADTGEEIIRLCRQLHRDWRANVFLSAELAENALERVLLLAGTSTMLDNNRPEARIRKVTTAIQADFRKSWTVEKMAGIIHLSASRFAHLFRETMGRTPKEYVESLKLEEAKSRLLLSDETLEMIASDLGYSSPFHLSARFKKYFGRSPKSFRRHFPSE